MVVQSKDLWSLVKGRPQVDPQDLADAIGEQVCADPLDYRTRLPIRDSIEALNRNWGPERLAAWLAGCPARHKIEAIRREHFERPGFPSLAERLMEKTEGEDIKDFLKELGVQLGHPVRVFIGGSAALILPGYVSRGTDYIDLVDELPAEIRSLHQALAGLKQRMGLMLAHFQSHYLPSRWQDRVHSLGCFGQLQVYLVDVHDIFLSKLFSSRDKDRDDLRMFRGQLDKETLSRRLKETAGSLLGEPSLRKQAVLNWYLLYGETLPEGDEQIS
jgi:Nucleotidyltransferase of unknown function (DUF6036)